MTNLNSQVYYADANIFITLFRYYPETVFGSLWSRLDELAAASRLRTIEQVIDEVHDSRFSDWAKARPLLLDEVGKDQEATDCLAEVVRELPQFVDHSKTSDEADQPLVAMVLTRNRQTSSDRSLWNHVVLTEEGSKKPRQTRMRIRDACSHYRIPCVAFLEMMELEDWRF